MSSTKRGHLAQLVVTALVGDTGVAAFQPPSPDQVQQYGSLIMQAVITVVTIWAAIRKALQKPVIKSSPGQDVEAA